MTNVGVILFVVIAFGCALVLGWAGLHVLFWALDRRRWHRRRKSHDTRVWHEHMKRVRAMSRAERDGVVQAIHRENATQYGERKG